MKKTFDVRIDPRILERKDDVFAWAPRIHLTPSGNTPLPDTTNLLSEMGAYAVELRQATEKQTGKKMSAVDVKRYFIIAGRIVTIVVHYQFQEFDNGMVGCGISNEEKIKWSNLGRQIRAFLN